MSVPTSVLDQYDIGDILSVERVKSGLVHETFAVKTSSGEYIIQKLHPVLSSQEIAQDFLNVTRFLHEQNFLAPECVLSKSGDVLVSDGDERWRMQTKLDGKTFDVIEDRSMLNRAGEMYAKFHKVMDGLNYQFQAKKVLHETEKIYDEFLQAVGDSDLPEVSFIKEELPKYFLPDDLPMRVIHGDPKVSNILFDDDGNAKAIIDLDTCNRRPILVELGDAFRSWCGNEEDDPNNKFCLRKFKSAWAGYKKGSEGFLTDRERELIPLGIGTITLELASRFMADYFNDSYFGWDSSRYASRKEHNLARVRGQLKEFHDYKEKLSKIESVIG